MKKTKRKAYIATECVACGSCIKVCPRNAIAVPKGIRAEVDDALCVGCGKCALACPAGVISIQAREEERYAE